MATQTLITSIHQLRCIGSVPWRIKLKNTNGRRNAFYEAEGIGRGAVTIRWGRLGTRGQKSTYSYTHAVEKLMSKLERGYEWAHAATKEPQRAPQPHQNIKTMRERVVRTCMKPITMEGLLDMISRDGLKKANYPGDYTDIFKNADAIGFMECRNYTCVVVRYGQELLVGVPK